MAEEKVNAELFLDLPDDETFLNELGLSGGFKRLVVKKANEVSGNNVVVIFFVNALGKLDVESTQ